MALEQWFELLEEGVEAWDDEYRGVARSLRLSEQHQTWPVGFGDCIDQEGFHRVPRERLFGHVLAETLGVAGELTAAVCDLNFEEA